MRSSGQPELADDPLYATNPGRTANREQLRPLLAARLAAKPAAEWFDLLIAVGVPCGPINTVDAGVAFAEQIGLNPIVTVGTGEAARPGVRHPVNFSKTPATYPLAPPEARRAGRRHPGLAGRTLVTTSTRRRSARPTPTRSPCLATAWPTT